MLRTDSIPKVTGAARYVEDMVMPGTLHGGVLRSPHHHARLISLNITPATIMPGVVAVLTADDIAGENGLGDYSQEEPVLCPVGGDGAHGGRAGCAGGGGDAGSLEGRAGGNRGRLRNPAARL